MATRLKDKPLRRKTETSFNEVLSMGPGTDRMRFILNMTPETSTGNLIRRPAIRAVEIGFSETVITGDFVENAHQIGDYDGTTSTGYVLAGTTYTNSRTAVTHTAANRIIEGIDCEIVFGKLVCAYLLKKASGTDLQLAWSFHHFNDPQLGTSSLQFAAGQSESDASDLSNAEYTKLHSYVAGQYWNRRIVNMRDFFGIFGYGVGGRRMVGTASDGTLENETIPLLEAQQLMMNCVPTDLTYMGGTSIVHADGSSSSYVKHGPKDCFAHYDKRGQAVYYGFKNTIFTYDGIASNEHLIPVLSNIDQSGVTMRPFVLQYSEPMRPASMHALGAAQLTGTAAGLDEEVVGMAELSEGTAMFTHTGIYYATGLAGFGGGGKMEILSDGVGADSRHSIKSLGERLLFANRKGVHLISLGGPPKRVTAFDELFGDGITVDKGPYSYYQGDSDNEADSQTEITKLETHDCVPWGFYKVDKNRLDRAVGCVWNDLYILFCSMTTHAPGDDNRLALVVNHANGAATTWLMPKNMGVRGFAHDGGPESAPYVMTRNGLARLVDTMSPDSVWETTGTGASLATQIDSDEPYPCSFAQSQWVPVLGESTILPAVNIVHEMPTDSAVDEDMKMRLQAWGQSADFNAGQYTIDTSQFTTIDVSTLDDLYKGDLLSWFKESTGAGGQYAYYAAANGDQATVTVDGGAEILKPGTRYVAQSPIRSTTIKCHANALAHKFQFHTLNQITIRNIDFQARIASKRGVRG